MPKLLNVHLWVKYANIYVTYEVVPINYEARITVLMPPDDFTNNADDNTAQMH